MDTDDNIVATGYSHRLQDAACAMHAEINRLYNASNRNGIRKTQEANIDCPRTSKAGRFTGRRLVRKNRAFTKIS